MTSIRFSESQAGLTAAHLLASIAILGILAAIAAPNLADATRIYSLRGAAREVYAELQSARMAAVMENNRYRFTLQSGHLYRVHDDNDSDGIEDVGETIATRDIQANSELVTIAATGPVTFAANGTAPEFATFTLTNTFGDATTVEVSPAGRIRIQ